MSDKENIEDRKGKRTASYPLYSPEIAIVRMMSGKLRIGVAEAIVLAIQLLKDTPLEKLEAMMQKGVDGRGKERLRPVRDYDKDCNPVYGGQSG